MNIKYLVVHCSDSPNGRETTAADIHRWHQERGWDGIGYHAVIKLDGNIEAGRPMYWQGAHADPYNHESLGVCLIGKDKFTEEQMRSLEGLFLALHVEYPDAQIVGHCDLNTQKTCPNFDVKAWWAEVLKRNID